MKAVKKPIPIEVEEFQPDRLPWPLRVHSDDAGYYVLNELHGSSIKIQPGDYVNVTDKTGRDIYPIDRATFERTYDVMAEPSV